MDFLRQQLAIVQDRLAGLTPSQKMLTAALAVIVVMTMLYWGRFASSREMVALMPNALGNEELASVTSALSAKGIEYKIDAGKVMVPADQRVDAMGDISFQGLVPAGTTNAIDAMLDKATPWQSQSELNARMNSAKQQYIAAILRKWPNVATADVVITDTPGGTITRRDPHLAVFITTKKGAAFDRRKLASSARAFTQNCMSGLKQENIAVAIDNAVVAAGDNVDAANLGTDSLAMIREAENFYSEKLKANTGVPNALVSVSVEFNNARRTIKDRAIDPTVKLAETQTLDTENHTPVGGGAAAPQEPGAVPNMSMDASPPAASSAGPSGVQIEKRKEQTLIDYNKKETETIDPGGTCTVVGATVSVPRSHIVNIWRSRQGKAGASAEPTDAELQPVLEAQVATVKRLVRAVTGIKDDTRINVSEFMDFEPMLGGPMLAAATPGAGNEFASMASKNAREIALGVLAVVSLFMVSRMVKKAEPTPLAAAHGDVAGMTATGLLARIGEDGVADEAGAAGGRRKPTSIAGEDIAGEVGGEGNVMVGQELDPEVLETSQVIEQVSNFVKTNPDAAAQMLGRWMSRDD